MRLLAFFLGTLFFLAGCTGGGGAPVTMEINLFSGMPMVAKLGDSEKQFLERATKFGPEKAEVVRNSASEGIKLSGIYALKDYGMRVYLRNGRVAMIELQDPFRGGVVGKKVKVFNLSTSGNSPWEKILIREFGIPTVRAAGGRLSSEAFFYSWGDVSFNKMGPNEIALYRDWDLANLRQKSFGRNVKFFKDK